MGKLLLAEINLKTYKHTNLDIVKLDKASWNCSTSEEPATIFGLAHVLNANCNEEQRCLAVCGFYSCLLSCKKPNYSSEAYNKVCS